jgi:hypothetical protein
MQCSFARSGGHRKTPIDEVVAACFTSEDYKGVKHLWEMQTGWNGAAVFDAPNFPVEFAPAYDIRS